MGALRPPAKGGRPSSDELPRERASRLAAALEPDAVDDALLADARTVMVMGPDRIAAVLSELKFPDSFIADACGAGSPTTVSNWRAGRRMPTTIAAERLDRLRAIVGYLITNLVEYSPDPAGLARVWLSKRQEWDGRDGLYRAIDLIAEDSEDGASIVYDRVKQFIFTLHGRPELLGPV